MARKQTYDWVRARQTQPALNSAVKFVHGANRLSQHHSLLNLWCKHGHSGGYVTQSKLTVMPHHTHIQKTNKNIIKQKVITIPHCKSMGIATRKPIATKTHDGKQQRIKRKRRNTITSVFRLLSGWGDSNARPLRPERSALPTALHPDALKASAKVQHFFEIRAIFSIKICLNRKKVIPLHPQTRNYWCHSSVGRAKDWKSLCPRFDSWWHHFLRRQNDVNPWISKKFGGFSFPRVGKISGIEANYTSLFKGLFSKARNVPLWGVYFILLQYVALFYITGFSVRFPNFVSLNKSCVWTVYPL